MKNGIFLRCGKFVRVFAQDKKGATMVEYGIVVALIAAICVGTLTSIGNDIGHAFQNLQSQIDGSALTNKNPTN